MGKICCVPGCDSGFKGVDMTAISMHTFRKDWEINVPRGDDWNVTGNTFICSKHFPETDIVCNRADNNTQITKKKSKLLLKRYLKKDATPTIFPNCPSYLTI